MFSLRRTGRSTSPTPTADCRSLPSTAERRSLRRRVSKRGYTHMTNLPLTLTAADYARLMPLATRAVMPDGIDLTLLLGRAGSWAERATMLRRALNDPVVHGGEASMAGHLRRVE